MVSHYFKRLIVVSYAVIAWLSGLYLAMSMWQQSGLSGSPSWAGGEIVNAIAIISILLVIAGLLVIMYEVNKFFMKDDGLSVVENALLQVLVGLSAPLIAFGGGSFVIYTYTMRVQGYASAPVSAYWYGLNALFGAISVLIILWARKGAFLTSVSRNTFT